MSYQQVLQHRRFLDHSTDILLLPESSCGTDETILVSQRPVTMPGVPLPVS
jgi:hypothetical protein